VNIGKLKIWIDKSIQLSEFKLTIHFKNIEEIVINEGKSLESKNEITSNDLRLKVTSCGDIKLPISVESFDVSLSGGTNAEFFGKSTNVKFTLNGSGKIDAEKLIGNNVTVLIAGAGYAVVYASDSIDASLAGVGSIKYAGNPSKVNSEIIGMGIIEEKKL
jgi:hypothetical protein